jgi:hypothetical protein
LEVDVPEERPAGRVLAIAHEHPRADGGAGGVACQAVILVLDLPPPPML